MPLGARLCAIVVCQLVCLARAAAWLADWPIIANTNERAGGDLHKSRSLLTRHSSDSPDAAAPRVASGCRRRRSNCSFLAARRRLHVELQEVGQLKRRAMTMKMLPAVLRSAASGKRAKVLLLWAPAIVFARPDQFQARRALFLAGGGRSKHQSDGCESGRKSKSLALALADSDSNCWPPAGHYGSARLGSALGDTERLVLQMDGLRPGERAKRRPIRARSPASSRPVPWPAGTQSRSR